MPNTAELMEEFNMVLSDVWETWRDHGGGRAGPFIGSNEELERKPGWIQSIGWVLGVSQAMEWSIEDPKISRKSWDPRG